MSRSEGLAEAPFDLRDFTRTARGSHRAGLGLDGYASQPLDAGTLELVALLGRLEQGALGYLRSVLVTPTHSDAHMTAFLVTWAYEKFWLADALEAIVEAHPARAADAATSLALRLRRFGNRVAERVEPIRESVVSNLIGEDVIAVHCLAGAVDEWLMQAAYQRLIDTTQHPTLRRTLAELLTVKQRHRTFFETQAADRLAASPSAAKLARRRLRRVTWPLGSQDEPPDVLAQLLDGLLDSVDLAAIDRQLDAYPGLAGLQPATTAAHRTTRRLRRPATRARRPREEQAPVGLVRHSRADGREQAGEGGR